MIVDVRSHLALLQQPPFNTQPTFNNLGNSHHIRLQHNSTIQTHLDINDSEERKGDFDPPLRGCENLHNQISPHNKHPPTPQNVTQTTLLGQSSNHLAGFTKDIPFETMTRRYSIMMGRPTPARPTTPSNNNDSHSDVGLDYETVRQKQQQQKQQRQSSSATTTSTTTNPTPTIPTSLPTPDDSFCSF